MRQPQNPVRVAEGERLRKALESRDITQRQLARELNALQDPVTEDIVNAMVRGVTRILPARRALIAQILRMPLDRIWPPDEVEVVQKSEMDAQEQAERSGAMVLLRLWRAAAGFASGDEFAFEEDGFETEAVPLWLCAGDDPDQLRLVRVIGNSMGSRAPSGSRVIIRLVPDPTDRVIGVFQSPERKLFLKLLRFSPGPELHSFNPVFPPILSPGLDGWEMRAVSTAIMKPYDATGANIEFNGGAALRG